MGALAFAGALPVFVSVVGLGLGAGTAACGGDDAPAVDPTSKQAADVQGGSQAVHNRKCVDCHTQDMSGSLTPIATTDTEVELYPPNLTNDKATGIGTWTDDQLANAIRNGVDNNSEELCPQMKHFATMTDYEAYSIVMYLRSIPAVSKKVPRSVCPPLKTKEEQQAAGK